MSNWAAKVLRRIHELAEAGKVSLTGKADRELALLDIDVDDPREVLAGLTVADSAGRVASAVTREWLYVFKPCVSGVILYIKLILRTDCVIVSCQEDESGAHDEE